MKKIIFVSILAASVFILNSTLKSQTYPPVVDLWGVTCQYTDDHTESDFVDSLLMSLNNLPCQKTIRSVFQVNEDNPTTPNPADYDTILSRYKTVANVMGCLMDSGEWDEDVFEKQDIINRLTGFMGTTKIRQNVDIWEVGNEVNGTWVYNQQPNVVMDYLDTLLTIVKNYPVKNVSRKTAITLYFYPDKECVETGEEDYMMLTWATNFVNSHPNVVYKLDYVLISYYRLDNLECSNVSEGWYWSSQIDSLKSLFPYSLIGFGEIGWPDCDTCTGPSDPVKVNIANTYYSYEPPNVPIYYPWIHAGFYWNYEYDCLTAVNNNYRNSAVWNAIDSTFGIYCNGGDYIKQKNRNSEHIREKSYGLKDNYPNPFNPITTICYSLPKEGQVTLKVYDMLGKEVRTLVNGIKKAGNYTVDFNASELSSGIYFYRMESNDFVMTKKMILIK